MKYLIQCINELLIKDESDFYVTVTYDIMNIKKEGKVIVDFNYVINYEDKDPEVVFTSRMKADPEFYELNHDEIIENLNKDLFTQILIRTHFFERPPQLDYTDPWRSELIIK